MRFLRSDIFHKYIWSSFKGQFIIFFFHATWLMHYGQSFICCYSTFKLRCNAIFLHWRESSYHYSKMRRTLRIRTLIYSIAPIIWESIVHIIVQEHIFIKLSFTANNYYYYNYASYCQQDFLELLKWTFVKLNLIWFKQSCERVRVSSHILSHCWHLAYIYTSM